MIFSKEASCARKDSSLLNMIILRKTALSLLNPAKSERDCTKKLMFIASLIPGFLLDILFRTK